MPLSDMSLEDCREYRPNLVEPSDLDAFWEKTLDEARQMSKPPTFELVDNGLRLIKTYDVTFSGFDGQPIKAWLHLPADATGPLPGVIEYIGYTASRGLSHQINQWAVAGYAHLVMDTRGQGWNTPGATGDSVYTGPASPGLVTRGITSPETYYYRRLYTDAVLCAEMFRSLEEVDSDRIFLAGTSQGGTLAVSTASFLPWITGIMSNSPFMCDIRRAANIGSEVPYIEFATYLHTYRDQVETVFNTLSYFDVAILAKRAKAPALFSIAMMDTICPPSTNFAAYNAYNGPKDLTVYEFNNHEGGGPYQVRSQFDWVAGQLVASAA